MRRTIALLCCSLCLVAMGLPALSSLLCPCNTFHQPAHTACCHACCHHTQEGTQIEAECCDGRHSLEIALYTLPEMQQERRAHLVVVLSAALLGEATPLCKEPQVTLVEGLGGFDLTPPLLGGERASVGLRAPPVTA